MNEEGKRALASVPRKLLLFEEGTKNEVKAAFIGTFMMRQSTALQIKRGNPRQLILELQLSSHS
jgi:hypothetical protein